MDLLVCLAGAGGRVVSREELLDRVWHDAVVNEEALSRAVSELRKALGDDPRRPRYVKTIHKSGYLLLEPVVAPVQDLTTRPRWALYRWPLAAWLTAAGLTVAFILSPWRSAERVGVNHRAPLTPLVATAFPGREIDPALDPAGRRVVFAWNGESDGDEYDLYVRVLEADAIPVRLTAAAGFEGHPAWSPDGTTIAFVRATPGGAAVWAVSADAVGERKLFDLVGWSFGLDWFPDGGSIAVSEPDESGISRIVRIALDTGARQPLSAPGPTAAGDYKPAVSPDGTAVAFVRGDQLGFQDVYVASIDPASATRVSRSGHRIRGVDWSPDAHSIIYASDLGGGFGLWHASIESGRRDWLPLGGQDVYNPSVAATGRLVFESISFDRNLWAATLDGAAERLPFASTRQESAPALSPDGSRLVFVSNRGGQRALWLATLSDGALRRLTDPRRAVAGAPVWSADGRRIAIALIEQGYARLAVVTAASGHARTFPGGDWHSLPVAWSRRDDNAVYLASNRDGPWDLWAVALESHTVTRLTTAGGIAAATADGDTLYYTRPGDRTFYRLRLDALPDAAAEPIGELSSGPPMAWTLGADGRIYGVASSGDQFAFARLDPATGTVEALTPPPGIHDGPFTLTPDSARVIYSRVERSESDLGFIDGVFE